MTGLRELFLMIIVLAGFSIIVIAINKVIKSKLTDRQKVLWIIAFIVLNVLAATAFIIFHDYVLSRGKRTN